MSSVGVVMENEQPESAPVTMPGEPSTLQKKRTRKVRTSWKRLGGNGLILAFAAVVVIFVWSFVNRTMIDPPVKPETTSGGKTHTIQLDILNGSGVPKLSKRFTEYLRARGFDVVETGNYKNSQVELTRVIDRAGQIKAAQQVAEALGVPKERVAQELDKNAYLDVSVVIGKDFRLLKPLN
jgi:hypothetical protein